VKFFADNCDLSAHDREVAAKALEDAADETPQIGLSPIWKRYATWLRDRSKAIRKGEL
jgi:hypothetical protein